MSTQEETVEQDLHTSETSVTGTENVSEPSSICDSASINETALQQPDLEAENPSSVEREKSTEPEENNTTKAVTQNLVVQEETNENDTSDKTSSTSKSRELKSILALSKEAKLDTNLPAKRKESTRKRDFAKLHSIGLSERSPSKSSQDGKTFKFPVTAEAELEEESFSKPYGVSMDSPKPLKRSRTSSRDSSASGSANEGTQKNRRICSGEIHILKPNKDMFCWRCHKDNVNIACETCPRSYHWKCLRQTVKNDKEHWPCPECVSILKAESTHTRSEAMKGMTLEHLCSLLKYALNRMIQCQGSEPFLHPVNDEDFPDYKKYIIQPMDLTKIEKNIKNNLYGSTQAFEADAKWILHNCIIFNSYQSKLTYTAKNIVRVCKQEMAEVELCPNCYLNANSKKNTWFVEVCPKPHILVWAKLKGFPYWPAKAMCTNATGMVDVRFFGAHDRAWVHHKECYLFSEKDPNTFKQKRYDIEKCIEEVDVYIENLRKVYGEFRYAPYKTFLEPDNDLKQLQILLPKYKNQKSKTTKKIYREIIADNKCESTEDDSKPSTSKLDKKDSEKPVDTAVKETEAAGEVSKTPEKIDECDIKEGEDVKKEEDEDSKTTIEMEQNVFNETSSSPSSPLNGTRTLGNDTTLEEGYGTDDSTADDIDLERRKAFVDPDHNNSVNEEIMEDEEDADTQVPNNISVDSLIRGKVKMRGGLASSPGKIKILPRRKSEAFDSLKRHTSENSDELPHQKLPRRNSDQSGKSDSSRISNLSDKINRIETFENMEVTLGTDDVARVSISEDISCDSSMKSGSSDNSIEIKRKPVQVDIDNAEFTISPSNKLKISDTLIKRLSDNSSPEGESSQRVEKVKKSLVTTEPTTSSTSTNSVTSPSKSHTDILIEKFKDVVEHSVVDFKEASVEKEDAKPRKGDETKSTEESENEIGKEAKTVDSDTSEKTPLKSKPIEETTEETIKLKISETSEDKEPTQECSPTTELLKKQKLLIQPSITDFTKVLKKYGDGQDSKSKHQQEEYSSDDEETDESESEDEDDDLKSIEIDKKRIFTIIHSSLNEQQINKSDSCETGSDGKDDMNRTFEEEENNKNLVSKGSAPEKNEGIKLIIKKKDLVKETDSKIQSGEEKTQAAIALAATKDNKSKSEEEAKTNKEGNNKVGDDKHKNKENSKTKETDIKSTSEEINESGNTIANKANKFIKIKISGLKSPPPSSSGSKHPRHEMVKPRVGESPIRKNIDSKAAVATTSKERHIESLIIPVKASISQTGTSNSKEFRSYSNLKNKHKVALSNGEESKVIDTPCSTQNVNENTKDSDAVPPTETPITSKKRKVSADESASAPSTKLVKLVPIESILNKGLKYKNVKAVTLQPSVSNVAVNKAPMVNRTTSSEFRGSRLSVSEEMMVDTIKSEPESDDDFQESENLEAKKRYLSALNISEKNADPSKDKENEIRTRARAEEKRERFKIVDNLTRVIDDVALNYSANHEGEDMPSSSSATNAENRKASTTPNSPWTEGAEITVKSFAKISTSTPQNQQRARKSFPTPSTSKTFLKQSQMNVLKRDNNNIGSLAAVSSPSNVSSKETASTSSSPNSHSSATHNLIQTSTTTSYTSLITTSSTTTQSISTASSSSSSSSISLTTTLRTVPTQSTTTCTATLMMNHSSTLTAGMNPAVPLSSISSCSLQARPNEGINAGAVPHVILFPNPTMNYGSPIVSPMIGMVSSTLNPQIPLLSAVTPTSQNIAQQHQQSQLKISNKPYTTPNVNASQNYIPQNEGRFMPPLGRSASSTPANNVILNNLLNQQGGVTCPSVPCSSNSTSTNGGNGNTEQQPQQQQQQSSNGTTIPIPLRERPPEEDLTLLNSIVPENVTRAVTELMMRPPPKLKPKPPGMLSSVFDDGIPSSAGEITTKINSVAHRLNDYLRGMLIETLEDLGKSANPEAKIISLQLEIEALKYKHNLEMQEIKKNMGTLLKDIQRSIEENRERIIAEARGAWETETIKRVELAKSKQWCANCSKEAKFYCCWNTSYCDYPCQQKHWPQHMGKCTQNIEKSTGSGPVTSTPAGQPVILRPTTSSGGVSKSGTAPRMVTKPTKVYMNNKTATGTPKTIKAYSSTGNQVTLIETTPGNYELLGNGQLMGGKVYPAGSNVLNSRFKSANIMSVSSSSKLMSNQSRPTNSSKEQMRSPPLPGSSRVPIKHINEEEDENDE